MDFGYVCRKMGKGFFFSNLKLKKKNVFLYCISYIITDDLVYNGYVGMPAGDHGIGFGTSGGGGGSSDSDGG